MRMYRFLGVAVAVVAACAVFRLSAQPSLQAEYAAGDSVRVESLLARARNDRGTENRVLYFGRQFVDVPYVAHTLEGGDTEHLVVNLRELDCSTFVETVVALAMCDKQERRTFADFCRNLATLRYRDGQLGDYTSRLHYFTWWAEDNQRLGIVEDVAPRQQPWGAFTAVQEVRIDYMSAHPTLYKQLKNHPEFVPVLRDYERATAGKSFRYIPKRNLAWRQDSALGAVCDGDIVAMLTDRDGLDTRHVGIAFWRDGRLHLLHASSLRRKVVMSGETFYEYEAKQPKHIGIRVLRLAD